jgi:glycosyltransferase involved in cell wall biosynthesis
LISVLVSVFNQELYLYESLESVSQSSLDNFELIIVDDCSNDNTRVLLKRIANQNTYLITNVNNQGLPRSLNKAFAVSKYDYIARMDADDICEPDRFKKQLDYMLAHPEIDILGSNATLIDMDSNVIGKSDVPLAHDDIIKALEYRNPMIHPTIMMKRSVLENLGGYDENLRKAQDLDLWHRAAKAGFRFANMPDCLIQYRVDLNKPTKTILKGFWVSFSHAVRNRSFKGMTFSVIDLVKYFLIKLKLYTPRSLRNKG